LRLVSVSKRNCGRSESRKKKPGSSWKNSKRRERRRSLAKKKLRSDSRRRKRGNKGRENKETERCLGSIPQPKSSEESPINPNPSFLKNELQLSTTQEFKNLRLL
jgi:hypothetical protein